MNKYKRLATDTILFAISNFGSKFLILLLVPLYTSVLSTEEYGISDLITTTVNLLYPILTLAICEAVLRYAMQKDTDPKLVLKNALWLVVISSVLLCFAKPLVSLVLKELCDYWWYFVLIYFLYNLHLCLANYTKAIDKTRLFAIQGITQTVFVILSNIVLLLKFKMGIHGYIISIIVGYCAAIIIMIISGKYAFLFKFSKIDFSLMKEMLTYSIPMIPAILSWWINTSADKYMIIAFIGISASGLYSVAHKIPTIVITVTNIFNQAWQLAAIKNRGEEDESTFHTSIYNALYLISLFVCMLVIPFSKIISDILFAKEFYVAWQYAPYLLIGTIFSALSGFLASAFRAAKKTKILLASVLVGAGVNIILNIFLINALGVLGATLATMIGFMVLWLQRIVFVQKIVVVRINWMKTVLSYLILIAGTSLIVFEIKFAYIIYALFAALIIAVNYKESKSYIIQVLSTVKKMLIKRKPV